MIGEFVDINATIGQDTLLSIDVTDAGGGGDYSLQPFGGVRRGHTGHASSLELWDALWPHEGENTRASQLTFIRQNWQLSNQAARTDGPRPGVDNSIQHS